MFQYSLKSILDILQEDKMMLMTNHQMGEYLCVGDQIALYSVETEGYAYSVQSRLTIGQQSSLSNQLAAQAEDADNAAEQKRQMGKRVRYGEIVQLKHVLTSKYVHMCTSQTSQRDKNNMMIMLHNYNAKNAQFRILPQYKVKSEGEVIGNQPWCREIGFFPLSDFILEYQSMTLMSGIRVMDQHKPRTLSPPTSGNTFWQIEAENGILNGDILRWEQQVRLRHMTTRKYLCIDATKEITLTDDNEDPKTVFRLYSVISERDEIRYESYCRIEHVLTGFWLHALKDEDYIRKKFRDMENSNDQSLRGLRWDSAPVRQVAASGESQYDDAFTIQYVEQYQITEFNFASGMVPFLLNLVEDRKEGHYLNAKKTHTILTAMEELRKFMMIKDLPSKNRQKLMRNLRIIDLLVKILQCPLDGSHDEQNLIHVFKEAYEILYTYMIGKSRKNALYFAKYIEFFQTQFTQKGGIGLNVAQMIVELIRDKRKIVDRITREQIDEFVGLLQKSQNYRFLDLLHVLCVCDSVAIPNNQSYIVKKWLQTEQGRGTFLTARGQDINRQPNILYITTDSGATWRALHQFVDPSDEEYDKDQHDFFIHQLDLYKALCFGRNDYTINMLTKELRYLTWEETFLSLRSTILPDAIRAKYCDLTTCMFVDTGNNYSVLDHPNICFIYEYVGSKDEEKSQGDFVVKELVAIFPVLRDWIADFLDQNKCMFACDIGHNMLIEQVVRLLYHLVKFGYYLDAEDVKNLLPPLLNLLDGRHDFPYPREKDKEKKEKDYTKEQKKLVTKYQSSERWDKSPETEAIVNAKYQVLEVLDLLLTYQRNSRLQSFVSKFKAAEESGGQRNVQESMLRDSFNPHDQSKKALSLQRKINKELRDMFNQSALFDMDFLTKVLVVGSINVQVQQNDNEVIKHLEQTVLIKDQHVQAFHKSSVSKKYNTLQILLTQDSSRVHREVLKNMPILRRLARTKLDDQQVKLMCSILDDLAEFCHLPMTPDEPHPMNQNIMISNGILTILFDVLTQEIDTKLLELYRGMRDVFQKTFQLVKLLARENAHVQHHLFERIDVLLDVRVVESDLALALKEVFIGNQNTCLKISPRQIQKIVSRAAEMQERAPEFLDLLGMIVKVVGSDLTLKRNQAFVMKYIMQNYKKLAYVLDMSREDRENILTNPSKMTTMRYYLSVLDLLALCAEGENMFIESLCQTILPMDDLLWVLNNSVIDNTYKKPFLRCLHHVYMKSMGPEGVDAGAGEMPHNEELWDYLSNLSIEMNRLTDSIKEDPDKIAIQLKTAPEKDQSTYSNEIDETDHIAKAIVMFSEIVGPLLFKPQHMKNVVNAMTIIVPASNMPNSNIEHVLGRFSCGITIEDTSSAVRRGNIEYYTDEVEINYKFKLFAKNAATVFAGHNTVSTQLKFKSNREFTELGGNEELPLGEEFQTLVKVFIDHREKKAEKRYELLAVLIEQLHISIADKRMTESARNEMDDLNIKCLQILRAAVHNEERKMDENWEVRTAEHKIEKQLKWIASIQNFFDRKGSMSKCLPHLATRNEDVAREVLGFLCVLLFNANQTVQKSMLAYFLSTREEVFFMAVRDRMALSTNSIKEKRSLNSQQSQRKKETSKTTGKISEDSFPVSRLALKQIQAYEDTLRQQRLAGWSVKRKPPSKKHKKKKKQKKPREKKPKSAIKVTDSSVNGIKKEVTFVNPARKEKQALIAQNGPNSVAIKILEDPEPDEIEEKPVSISEGPEYRHDGYIELVLKVMARMCDGQNHDLQDYLREQPDNVKSFNIIAEVTRFLNVVYSNINFKSIDLVIQLFNTMNEFTAGNQENRIVIYDNKIIDYINFILRAGDFESCTTEKILLLRESIANLILSLIEENGPGASEVSLEVKDTLDKVAVLQLMQECYEVHEPDKKKIAELKSIMMDEPIAPKSKMKSFSKIGGSFLRKVKGKQLDELADAYMDVGFRFYLIFNRMIDVDPKLLNNPKLKMNPIEQRAFIFYKKNCMSIEIVKDDELQKVNFRVKNKRVLREEVKENLKWNVDRSSPSNKIRDLMGWTKDIMKDIIYQRTILSNPIAIGLTKGWLVWNHLVTAISFVINILMLVTWQAKASLGVPAQIKDNTTATPPEIDPAIYNPTPDIAVLSLEQYDIAIYVLGGTHNFLCVLILISYFVGNHPRLPKIKTTIESIKQTFSRKKKDDDHEEDAKKPHQSKLDAKLLSFTTFYYLAFLALSIGGTLAHGYFFAFHMLNIVNNNQLLSGVIKAVTQNGKSLVWVAILGLVVFYLYAIVSFALMRSMFDPESYLYCASLWQCTITVIRYGLIGELFEEMKAHKSEATFAKFGWVVLYHVSFFVFITTIGLNIIFGIIVDTFSELRDLKWTSEADMRDTCFICSRNSYDFEHHGKGFDHHVRHEHNMWAYVFFFIHLNGTKVNDYTALEMYVYKLLLKENYDFFPLDRALSLSGMGKDSTETKIDDLLYHVTSIVERQRREELEKKRSEERVRQKVWEQKHRLGSFRRRAKLPAPAEQDPLTGMIYPQLPGDEPTTQLAPPQQYLKPTYPQSGVLSGRTSPRRYSDVGLATSMLGRDKSELLSPLPVASRYDRRPSIGSRSGSPSRMEHDRLRRRSPSRYDDDDPYLGSVSPIRYEDRLRSPSWSRQGSDGEIRPITPSPLTRRDTITSGMLSPRWQESRTTSPRGGIQFFPESEAFPPPPPSFMDRRGSTDRRASDFRPESVEGLFDLPEFDHPGDRDRDADSTHSSEYRGESRY
ncbi:unnamed protein product [Mytilus edulis]|uniref:MIR domain-containing protein n=1 Tax=Mytilus edulis TaxID=6550 RepID=A0A8S3SVZ1_MYTED|nr:unnamed protein product [Mytilus edulis]